jgi:acetate kinase
MKILVYNAGSSTLKLALFEADGERLLADAEVDWLADPPRLRVRLDGASDVRVNPIVRTPADAVRCALELLEANASLAPGELAAVGHRVVHGGERFTTAVQITPEVERAIDALAELAPLHNPASLAGIRAVAEVLPALPQVAAFDTAFHATLSEAARTYAIPLAWTREWSLRRYGFHGLSHSYCAQRAAELLGRADLRLVVAHLGNGASLSAVQSGVCIDTSMGFTPLDGLMMGTRSGSVDPGLLLHLLRRRGIDAERLDHVLNHESGLLGVSQRSSDMREVLAAARSDPAARLAIELYVHRVVQTIGAMAATLGGVDGLVFAAGVGENSAEIRERVCRKLGHLGLVLDAAANAGCKPDADVAQSASAARILVIATREDLTILRETRRVLAPRITPRQPSALRSAP